MRRLLVVTHPEATHHVEGVVGGQHDSELTPRGLEQATAIAARVRELVDGPCRLWSSDLRRCVQTAGLVGRALGVEPSLDRRLREKSYGAAEGRPQGWLDERFVPPPAYGDRLDHHEGVAGAETRRELGTRVYAFLDELLARPEEQHVVVTHGFAMTYVVAGWIQMPLEATGHVVFRASSGGITTLGQDDFFHNRAVLALDDVSHLLST